MKKTFIVSAIFAFSCIVNFSFAQKSTLSMGKYDLNVITSPSKNGFGFVQAAPVKPAKDENAFGFWFSGTVLELKNAASKKTLANITASELTEGKTTEINGVTQTTYTVGSGANKFELLIESAQKTDDGMPLGKMLSVSFKVKGINASKIDATLQMKTDGVAEKLGTASVVSNRMIKGVLSYPAIVVTSVSPAKITVSKRIRKESFQDISFEVPNVSLSSSDWSDVFVLSVSGSTVDDGAQSVTQANRIVNHVIRKEAVPDVVMFHHTSSSTTTPGDTITYTISYINIGSGTAVGAAITDSIPSGLTYLEGSAKGDNTEVSIERKSSVGNQLGEASLVQWKIMKPILPGEGGSVSLKAVVR